MNLIQLFESPQLCPECGGPAFGDLLLAEKKDACYHKVRSRYRVWPSAYASGALVQCRKKGAANWGNKNESQEPKYSNINDDDWYEIDDQGKVYKQSGPSSYQPTFGTREIKLDNGHRVVRGMTLKSIRHKQGMAEGILPQPTPNIVGAKWFNDYHEIPEYQGPGHIKGPVWTEINLEDFGYEYTGPVGGLRYLGIKSLKKPTDDQIKQWLDSKVKLLAKKGFTPASSSEQSVAEAFGPLPKDNQQIRLGRHTVDIERVGLDNNYIRFAWHDSQGREHSEEVPVGDLGSYDALKARIRGEISGVERRLKKGVAEGAMKDLDIDLQDQQWDAIVGYVVDGLKNNMDIGRMELNLYQYAGREMFDVDQELENRGFRDLAHLADHIKQHNGRYVPPRDFDLGKGVAEGSDELYQKAIRKFTQRVANDYLGGGNEYMYGAGGFDSEMFGVDPKQAQQDFKSLFSQYVKKLQSGEQGMAEGSEQKMSVQDTLAYLKKVMGTESHEDWRNHIINTNEYFVLQDIPVNSLRSDLSGLDKANVEKYKQMDFSKAPPIVIGSDGNILDGYHRVNVAKALKVPTLKAWVGAKKQSVVEDNNEKIAGRYDPDDFDAMVLRLKKLAGAGPMQTVWDPKKRVYRNMPTAVQPPKTAKGSQ